MRGIKVVSAAIILGSLACGGGGTEGVTAPPPAVQTITSVTVSLSSSTIEIGSTVTATATVLDQNSSPITGKTVTWTSDNETAATVSQAGVVTGKAAGTVNITATVEGKQGKAAGTVVTSSAWVVDATVLNNATYGGATGALADVAVVKLNDGRFRMWIGAIPGTATGIFSAISTDGVQFTPEAGVRISGNVQVSPTANVRLSHPFVMRLDDGRIRLFANAQSPPGGPAGIYSLTSTDEGVTFTLDAGIRLTVAAAGVAGGDDIIGSKIVKMKTGGYRMYFSSSTPTTVGSDGFITLGKAWIGSAFSTDLITWTVDAGRRIGEGSTLTGNAVHPGAIANEDGSVTLVYFRNTNRTTFASTSADGLSFTTEATTGFTFAPPNTPAADPFLMHLPNGDVRMFYNWGNDNVGVVYVAHRRAFSLTSP